MEALTILMPVLQLVAITIGACITILLTAAFAGKFFGGYIK